MNHEPLLPLGRAWLDELRVLGIITDETSAASREKLIPRANAAARQVDAELNAQRSRGEAKALSKAYLAHKAESARECRNPMPWSRFLHMRKQDMIRALARANAQKFRWQPIRDKISTS